MQTSGYAPWIGFKICQNTWKATYIIERIVCCPNTNISSGMGCIPSQPTSVKQSINVLNKQQSKLYGLHFGDNSIYLFIYLLLNQLGCEKRHYSDLSSNKLTGAVLGADWWFVMQMKLIELSKVLKA